MRAVMSEIITSRMPIIGAPGAGKSTLAAGLFRRLKRGSWNVELVTEYTKELILTGDRWPLSDELLVFAGKHRRIKRLEGVDIVITDSPLINSAVYGGAQFGPEGAAFFKAAARRFDSFYVAVRRVAPYIPVGRMPGADAADAAGREILGALQRMGMSWFEVDGDDRSLPAIEAAVTAAARARGMRPLRPDDLGGHGKAAPGLDDFTPGGVPV